jgi:hypothetical protein
MALGHDRFKNERTSLRGGRLHSLPPGRKLGWCKSSYNFVLTPQIVFINVTLCERADLTITII